MFYVHAKCTFVIFKFSKVMQCSNILKVWRVTHFYGFCWKFTDVCSSERILQIDQELTKL